MYASDDKIVDCAILALYHKARMIKDLTIVWAKNKLLGQKVPVVTQPACTLVFIL